MAENTRSSSAPDISDEGLSPGRFGLMLALLVFVAFPEVLLGLEAFVIRDFGVFSYPVAFFQRECFWRGVAPLWNPYNNCGLPFLAQWNTMVLYPPALLYLLLPLTWGLGFFCMAHLWFAGMGMYVLARQWTGNRLAASVAGVAFAFGGLSTSLLVWPSHIATLSWMPWMIWIVPRAWSQGGRVILAAALMGAAQMLAGGPETILLTWLVVAALWLGERFGNAPRHSGGARPPSGAVAGAPASHTPDVPPPQDRRAPGARAGFSPSQDRAGTAWITFRRFAVVVLLVAGLAAAQLLPFLDLAAHSQRREGYADARWSLPGRGWANFLVPMVFGSTWRQDVFFQYGQYWISSYYPGIGIVLLALWALWSARDRRVRVLVVLSVGAYILALGDQTIVYRLLRRLLPQLTLMTYPVKFVIVIAFSAPLLAAFALARWGNAGFREGGQECPRSDPGGTRVETGRLEKGFAALAAGIAALIGFILIWAWLFPKPEDLLRAECVNGAVRAGFLAAVFGLLVLLKRPASGPRAQVLSLLLLFVLWLDLKTHVPSPNPTVPVEAYAPGVVRAAQALEPEPALGKSRAMVSPLAENMLNRSRTKNLKAAYATRRLSYFSNCNLLDETPKVDGFFSLFPRHCGLLASLIYTSTNAPPAPLLDFLSVSQVSAPADYTKFEARRTALPEIMAGQRPVFLDDDAALSGIGRADFDSRETVFLPPETQSSISARAEPDARVVSFRFGLDEVEARVETPAPCIVTLSQTYYHRWQARVDEVPAPVFRANYAFQAIQVPAGSHWIRLSYEDRGFELGVGVSVLTLLGCLGALLRLKRAR